MMQNNVIFSDRSVGGPLCRSLARDTTGDTRKRNITFPAIFTKTEEPESEELMTIMLRREKARNERVARKRERYALCLALHNYQGISH